VLRALTFGLSSIVTGSAITHHFQMVNFNHWRPRRFNMATLTEVGGGDVLRTFTSGCAAIMTGGARR